MRFLNFVINHPILKEDGVLAVFLTEPNLEAWRKHTSVSLEEEYVSKRLDPVEEMSIPSDLNDKLGVVRNKIGQLIEQWQKICILAERLIKRREAAAADMSRLTMTLDALNEVNAQCWRGEECELCMGVRDGVQHVSKHIRDQADEAEQRTQQSMTYTLEALKSQRDLYIAVRDLFIRHHRLSGDSVEQLKKRIETNTIRIQTIQSAAKENWEAERDKLSSMIERDQATIQNLLRRRVFIRYSMWHELRVVLHNRENALLTQSIQTFARDEAAYAESMTSRLHELSDSLENMPYE